MGKFFVHVLRTFENKESEQIFLTPIMQIIDICLGFGIWGHCMHNREKIHFMRSDSPIRYEFDYASNAFVDFRMQKML